MAENICFVIAPIGEPDTPIRKHSDQFLKYIVGPAAKECGFTALRADAIDKTGIITSQVIQYIIEAPMVVADLTARNPNVFYELALRHALRKPFVQLIDQSEQIPFDVAGIRTIRFSLTDLDSVEPTKTQLVKQMRSMAEPNADIQSPITEALVQNTLTRSDNVVSRGLGEILQAISTLTRDVDFLKRELVIKNIRLVDQTYITSRGNAVVRYSDLAKNVFVNADPTFVDTVNRSMAEPASEEPNDSLS